MAKKPDAVNQLPNGWTEQIFISKAFRPDGSISQVRKWKDENNKTRRVWHEVFSSSGRILHQHEKPARDK